MGQRPERYLMYNKKVWVLYGLNEGATEVYRDFKFAERAIADKHGATNKVEKAPGVWSFGGTLVLRRQDLFGSNGLGS